MRIQLSDIPGSTITLHPYRTARVISDDVDRVQYGSGDELAALHVALAKAVGTHMPDNHEVYEMVLPSGQAVCVQFSDWKALFGSTVVMRRW